MKKYFENILKEICKENDIQLSKIDNYSIYILQKDGLERIIWSKKFEINSLISARIADNKSATYSVLSRSGVPCIEHYRLAIPFKNGHYAPDNNFKEKIHSLFPEKRKLVIKPENGTSGKDVFIYDDSLKLSDILNDFSKAYAYIAVSPYYDIKNEYRVFHFNGENLVTYKKSLPCVIGDGINNIYDLILNKYGSDNRIKITQDMKNIIPKSNNTINLSWKFNLSSGSISEVLNDKDKLKSIHKIASLAAKSIHINFATIDIVELTTGEFKVLEINSGVVMERFIDDDISNYDLAKNMYEKVILHMFGNDNN